MHLLIELNKMSNIFVGCSIRQHVQPKVPGKMEWSVHEHMDSFPTEITLNNATYNNKFKYNYLPIRLHDGGKKTRIGVTYY